MKKTKTIRKVEYIYFKANFCAKIFQGGFKTHISGLTNFYVILNTYLFEGSSKFKKNIVYVLNTHIYSWYP